MGSDEKVATSYLFSEIWGKFMRLEIKRPGNEEHPNFHHHVQCEILSADSPEVHLRHDGIWIGVQDDGKGHTKASSWTVMVGGAILKAGGTQGRKAQIKDPTRSAWRAFEVI